MLPKLLQPMRRGLGKRRGDGSFYCRRCRVNVNALNCPRCSQIVGLVPRPEQVRPRRYGGNLGILDAHISEDIQRYRREHRGEPE